MKNWKTFKVIDYLIIMAVIGAVLAFVLLPFGQVFAGAFAENGQFTLKYFTELFDKKPYLIANTLKLGFWTTLLGTISSVAVAIYWFLAKKNGQRIILAILGITMISPPFVTALSYINLFGRRGLITYHILGLSTQPYGMWGIVFMQALGELSLNALLLIGVLSAMDRSMVDSARSLGAGTNHIIKDILLPNMSSGIKAVVILTFFSSLSDFGTPTIIGGSFNVLASESYFAVIAEGNVGKAAALNILLLLPALLVLLVYQRSFSRLDLSNKGLRSSLITIKRQGVLFQLSRLIAVFFLGWLTLQYSGIFFAAVSRMEKGELILTWQNIRNTLPYIDGVVVRSVLYSLIAALGSSVLGLLIAYYLHIRKIPLMKTVDQVATLPYIIPGTFFGLGYLLAFNSAPLELTGTTLIVILNVTFKLLPFSTKVSNAAMEGVPLDMINSVSDLGGSRFDELKDVILPIAKNALSISFVNGFTATMTTVGTIIFLVTPGQKLLTLVMFDAINGGKYDVGSVIAVLVILICLAVNGLYLLLVRRR